MSLNQSIFHYFAFAYRLQIGTLKNDIVKLFQNIKERKMMFSQSCAQSFAQNGEFCAKYEMSLLRCGTPHAQNKRTQ